MGFKIENIPSNKKRGKTFSVEKFLKREIHLFGDPFNTKQKENFYTELSVLLDAGVSLKDGLLLIANAQKKQANKQLCKALVQAIVLGKSFAEAIRQKAVFSAYEYYSLKIGEETGNLKKVCCELGTYFRRRNEQRKNTLNALSYPVVVFLTALLAVLFMLSFVVPMFAEIFKQNKVELPALTKIVMAISEGIQTHFKGIIVLVVLLFFGLKKVAKKRGFQKYAALLLLKVPVVGELFRKVYVGQFTQATALLVSAKIPVLQSVQLTKKMIDFYPMQVALQKIENRLLEGTVLSTCLAEHAIFDRKMIALMKVAEETNQNEFVFKRLTTQYNEDVQQQSKMLTTLLEPLIIVFLGIVVALVLIAMYMPMFQLSTVIG